MKSQQLILVSVSTCSYYNAVKSQYKRVPVSKGVESLMSQMKLEISYVANLVMK